MRRLVLLIGQVLLLLVFQLGSVTPGHLPIGSGFKVSQRAEEVLVSGRASMRMGWKGRDAGLTIVRGTNGEPRRGSIGSSGPKPGR